MRDDLALLAGYHSPQAEVPVRLNTNESAVPPPTAWRDAFAAEVSRVEWNRYPDRTAAGLRAAIGGLHGVGPEQVFAANGSNEVLQTLLLAYAGPGRAVLTFEPTYQLHAHIARVTGATVVSGERRPDFSLDVGGAIDAIRRYAPSVTFLCSPNNPTGLAEPAGAATALLGAGPGLLVVDEAYGQFAGHSTVDLVDDETPLAVVRTFSKTWSMAAARLGYLVGPTWLVDVLQSIVLPYHLDAAKQAAGRLAVRFVDEMEERVALVVSERGRLAEALESLGVGVVPSEANFLLVRLGERDAHAVWQGLLAQGVLVRDCSGWPRLAGCLRVTVGTPAENDAFLRAMAGVL